MDQRCPQQGRRHRRLPGAVHAQRVTLSGLVVSNIHFLGSDKAQYIMQ